jgi:phosphocarrier protein
MSQSAEKNVRLINEQGLHLRPADLVVRLANNFSAQIELRKGDQVADCKSILSVITLAAEMGSELRVLAQGDDANEAVDAIVELIESGFAEDELQGGTQLAGEH